LRTGVVAMNQTPVTNIQLKHAFESVKWGIRPAD
jgi:hypothetical protein